jgi:hypothetical protein
VLRATPEVGARLADRYRLSECISTDADGISIWHATDEMLARPVGMYLIPEDHELAEAVIGAARAAATFDDARFVRILDAVRRGGTVHIVYEWLPEARPLSEVLTRQGPLEPTDAQLMITDAADALAHAHAAGLAHLRLQPDTVLLTPTGQVKIFGLCVEAALHSTSAIDPARADTRALGRVLHAALTAKWPEGEAFGLPAAPYENGAICTPRQVRAGVPDAVDAIVDRVLNAHPRMGAPLRSPAELAAELRQLPRPRPPAVGTGPGSDATGPMATVNHILAPFPAPDGGWKPSAATRGVQIGVIGMLVVGLALLSWQIVRAVGSDGNADALPSTGPLQAVRIADVRDFDPPPGGDGQENGDQASLAVDGNPDTVWRTDRYTTATFGKLKPGVGLVLDLGRVQTVRQVRLIFPHEGSSVEIRAVNANATTAPRDLASYLVADSEQDLGTEETLRLSFATRTRFLLIWLTTLPRDPAGGYRGGISEVSVSG